MSSSQPHSILFRTLVLVGVLGVVPLGSTGVSSADEKPAALKIATWNLEWFFDDYKGDNYSQLAKKLSAPSRAEWDWRLAAVAGAIAEMKPTILALQEVENERVLFYLKSKLKKEYGLDYAIAFAQGGDYFTEQDVALLVASGLVEYGIHCRSQEMRGDKSLHGVPKHLFARFEWGSGGERESLLLVNVHLSASPKDGSAEKRRKSEETRQRQARLIRRWIDERIEAGENVIVLGDFNTDQRDETSPDSELGILRNISSAKDEGDMCDLQKYISPDGRQTHLLPDRRFDRILVSRSLLLDDPGRSDLVFKSAEVCKRLCVQGEKPDEDHWDIYYKIPQKERDLSVHYPVVSEFEFK